MTEVDTVAKGEGRKERKEDCEISIRLPLEGLDTHTHTQHLPQTVLFARFARSE